MAIGIVLDARNPAFCISVEAAKEPEALIAMATHGRSAIDRWLLGCVTHRVFQATTYPMLFVRA